MIFCDYIITKNNSVFYFNYALYVTFHYNVNEAPINIVIHCVMYSLVISKRRSKINNDFCESIIRIYNVSFILTKFYSNINITYHFLGTTRVYFDVSSYLCSDFIYFSMCSYITRTTLYTRLVNKIDLTNEDG